MKHLIFLYLSHQANKLHSTAYCHGCGPFQADQTVSEPGHMHMNWSAPRAAVWSLDSSEVVFDSWGHFLSAASAWMCPHEELPPHTKRAAVSLCFCHGHHLCTNSVKTCSTLILTEINFNVLWVVLLVSDGDLWIAVLSVYFLKINLQTECATMFSNFTCKVFSNVWKFKHKRSSTMIQNVSFNNKAV